MLKQVEIIVSNFNFKISIFKVIIICIEYDDD